MKRCFILFAMALAFVAFDVSEARAQFIPNQEEAPGHVDESLPDSVKAPALFLYGFYAAYMHALCYGDQMCDNICKDAFSPKLFRKVKQVQQNDLYDPITGTNNCTYLTIPTLKVVPMGNHWYEVSYQWPWNDKGIHKIPFKVVQNKAHFEIVNIRESAGPLLPEKP